MQHNPIPVLTPQQIERFERSIERGDGCWEWQGSKGHNGYGSFCASGINFRAHRISFALFHGRDPGDLLVCHSCDNPPCVNPAHLWLGTQVDNINDMLAKGRAPDWGVRSYPETCARCGHTRTDDYRLKSGHRRCSNCKREYSRQYRREKRAA